MRTLAAALAFAMFSLPAFAQLIPEDAHVEKVADGYRFTEGPAAGPDDCIYFTDIPAELILKYDPETGETETFIENTGQANGLMFARRGLQLMLYSCDHRNRALTQQFWALTDAKDLTDMGLVITEGPEVIVGSYENNRLNSPNDLAVAAHGRVYFTDPRYGNRDSMEMEIEGVYYINPHAEEGDDDFGITRIIDDLTRPNGIVLSPDESILYVADHGTNEIFAYDITAPGEIDNKRLFARLNDGEGGGPDGMCVDAEGRVYAAGQNKIWIYNPDGSFVDSINVGPACTNCTFANDGKTLYITANRGLYAIELITEEPAEQVEDDE